MQASEFEFYFRNQTDFGIISEYLKKKKFVIK